MTDTKCAVDLPKTSTDAGPNVASKSGENSDGESQFLVNEKSVKNSNSSGSLRGGEELESSQIIGECVEESVANIGDVGTPRRSLLETDDDDVAGDEGDNGEMEDYLEASTSRPQYSNQCSKIAEIVEHSGSHQNSELAEQTAEGAPGSENALAAEAWNLAGKGLDPTAVEEEDEFIPTRYLRQRLKHVFVLSAAGKPIYSRYGNEEELSSLIGVMQALVSFVSRDNTDGLVSIRAGAWLCVFLHRWPLIMVASSRASDSYAQLKQLLFAVHQQIFSILTSTQLSRIFENRTNFDLRRFLSGTERSFQNLISLTESTASLFLNAVKVHPMNSSLRQSIGQAMAHYAAKAKNHLVFAVVVANDQLVTIARMKRYTLHPPDLHLIINLVAANPSFKNAESWSPLCLPIFDNTGFLHAHISYLNDDCRACLLLLTVDRSAFFALSDVKKKIVEKLDKTKMLPLLSECISKRHYFRLNEVGVNDLWHFLYKSQATHQFTCPAFDPPYAEAAAQKRLFATYLKVHHQMHTSGQSLKILFISGELESVLGWVGSNFELYTVFAPLTPKAVAVAKVDKLIEWLKKEEQQLFILNPSVY